MRERWISCTEQPVSITIFARWISSEIYIEWITSGESKCKNRTKNIYQTNLVDSNFIFAINRSEIVQNAKII